MKTISIFILLSLILIIPLLDLLHPGFPVTHDGQDHIARIANFYQNLKEGTIIPRWAPNLNWGYGHPILMFLYPLSSYITSLFHFLGLSLIDSTKTTFAIGMFFSGITMYLWLSSIWRKPASFIGAIMYVFVPYRFVEIYVRGDIGENLAFIFVPLALYFIHRLAKKNSPIFMAGCALSTGMLILAHNAISLMFLPLILLYILYELCFSTKNRPQFMLQALLGIVLGFGISAFFWIPGLLEGKYTLRNIVTAGEYKNRFVSFIQLLYGPWDYGGSGSFTVQLGIIQWLSFFGSLILLPFLFFRNKREFFFGTATIFYTVIAILLMLPITQIVWRHIMLLQNFQFPWRFLAITVFTTALLGCLCIESLPQKFHLSTAVILLTAILFLSKDYWHAKEYKVLPEKFFTGIYNGTTDTGESAPIWSVRFMERAPANFLDITQGEAKVLVGKRTSTHHTYTVIVKSAATLVENTLYFPGWSVLVDGKGVPVEFQDQMHRGLMEFHVQQGVHKISILFSETKMRLITDVISLASFVFIGFLMIRKKHFTL